ncbi:MAG: hypothetical protein NTY88_14390 [Bacteroidetes bacterium]|nr:hypothetical protein [Bacteroidota bacterium]
MKNFICLLIVGLSVCKNVALSQTVTPSDTLKGFWGINFGKTKELATKILSTKSVTITEKVNGNITSLNITNAVFSNRKVLLLTMKFVNNKFFEATLNYDTERPNMRGDFESIANILDEKYFKGNRFADFKYPYSEHDEHEETALNMGYGKLESFWTFANKNAIALETKFFETFSVIVLTYQDVD